MGHPAEHKVLSADYKNWVSYAKAIVSKTNGIHFGRGKKFAQNIVAQAMLLHVMENYDSPLAHSMPAQQYF